MKIFKISFVIILFFLNISCIEKPIPDEDCHIEQHGESIIKNLEIGDLEILVIDSCEYLVIAEDFKKSPKGFGFMAHKGNCKNPIHKHNQ